MLTDVTCISVNFASAADVLTQIGDGQIQGATTENQSTTATATETSSSTAVETETSTLSQYSNAAPRAIVGGGVAALAGLAALL
ncbi:hypothetical protein C6P40_004055 [Pichia californica]|uniref:Uncharacterized protein n=1 Tax=Pichia californica TaxID=460514 RepID=A0A9P7BHG6_9ASCO|nr:hypothetical protein C6P42_001114 [[Candida] californica]KAG0690004.1 hypothetical protein C6P40_004055 [[Candida] californica]